MQAIIHISLQEDVISVAFLMEEVSVWFLCQSEMKNELYCQVDKTVKERKEQIKVLCLASLVALNFVIMCGVAVSNPLIA